MSQQTAQTFAMKKAILTTEIDLRLRPSKILWGWWAVFSILVLASLAYSLPVAWACCLAAFYSLASIMQWTQLVATGYQKSIQAMQVDVFGRMQATDRAGQHYAIQVLAGTVLHPWCLVLHVRCTPLSSANLPMTTRERRWLILPDQADPLLLADFRRWCRWGLDCAPGR